MPYLTLDSRILQSDWRSQGFCYYKFVSTAKHLCEGVAAPAAMVAVRVLLVVLSGLCWRLSYVEGNY